MRRSSTKMGTKYRKRDTTLHLQSYLLRFGMTGPSKPTPNSTTGGLWELKLSLKIHESSNNLISHIISHVASSESSHHPRLLGHIRSSGDQLTLDAHAIHFQITLALGDAVAVRLPPRWGLTARTVESMTSRWATRGTGPSDLRFGGTVGGGPGAKTGTGSSHTEPEEVVTWRCRDMLC